MSNEFSNKSPIPTVKTPQIPNLDLEKIHSNNGSRKVDIKIDNNKVKKTHDIVIDETTDKKIDRKTQS